MRKIVIFVNFAKIASLCVGFYLGTLHRYFFHQDFWPNLNFPFECQIKLVLKSLSYPRSSGREPARFIGVLQFRVIISSTANTQ